MGTSGTWAPDNIYCLKVIKFTFQNSLHEIYFMKFIFGNSIFETLFSKLFQIHFFEIHIIKLTLQISLYKFHFLKSNFCNSLLKFTSRTTLFEIYISNSSLIFLIYFKKFFS